MNSESQLLKKYEVSRWCGKSYSYASGSNWTVSRHIETNTNSTTDGLYIGYKRKKNQELQNL